MKNVISLSVFGDNPKYTVGALRNIEMSPRIYDDWVVHLYYNDTVPMEMINKYKTFDHVKLIDMTNNLNMPGMFWRFLPRDCERFISRDVDSRLSMREKYAVDEWIVSGKSFHVMRDHPHHDAVPVYGGMFGVVISEDFIIEEKIKEWIVDKDRSLFNRMGDAFFLQDVIYKHFLDKKDIISHDSVWTHHPFSKSFPRKMENYNFVGEIFDENNNRYYQYQEWTRRKENGF